MASIPAICETKDCNTVFPSAYSVSNSRNISFHDCKSSPCPKCGGIGRIPDGTYDVIEESIFASLNSASDISVLQKIQKTIARDLKRNKSPKNITKTLKKSFPEHNQLWALIPKNKKDALWYFNFILQTSAAIAAIYGGVHLALSNDEKETIINNFHYEYHHHEARPEPPYDNQKDKQLSQEKDKGILI